MQLSDILSDLHEDHRNMAILLNLLERETAHIQACLLYTSDAADE